MVGMRFVFAVLFAAASVSLAPIAAHADAVGPTRIMIVGDSVSQGSTGDWTWRYRLARDLQASDTPVDFVGPNTGLKNPRPFTLTDQRYADPTFDHDHAARWGMGFSTLDWTITDLMTGYTPDVVVEELGVNDLAGLGYTPDQVAGMARQLVTDARAVNPAVTVVLGQLTQRWVAGVPAYNALLVDLAAELDTPTSRVVVAGVQSYDRRADTYDGLHPAATGEVKIARAVAMALAGVGIGTAPAFPRVVNGPTTVAALSAKAGRRHGRVRLAWTTPLGANEQVIYYRPSKSSRWRVLSLVTSSQDRLVVKLHKHRRYLFRAQARKGWAVSPRFSATARVRTS